MKTYKIEEVKAKKLRSSLLWSNIVMFVAAFFMGLAFAVEQPVAGGAAAVLTIVFGIWGIVSYWRAVWNLWEWPGVGLALLVGLFVGIGNAINSFLGLPIAIAFLIYVYVQLGKQVTPQDIVKREVFEE